MNGAMCQWKRVKEFGLSETGLRSVPKQFANHNSRVLEHDSVHQRSSEILQNVCKRFDTEHSPGFPAARNMWPVLFDKTFFIVENCHSELFFFF